MASLSPEGPPASGAGPVWGRCELPLSSGGHRVEPDHKDHQDVRDGEAHLEAGSLVHAALESACQEGQADVVPSVHGHLNITIEK